MKILVLFIDMFRPNLLNTWNKKNKVTDMDKFLNKLGGTSFTNCWTPSPDTPRSQNVVWSSRYPIYNGCDTRIKYPKYNAYYPERNFLRVFKDNGYQLNIYVNHNPCIVGELPEDFEDENVWKGGLLIHDFLKKLTINENTLTLVLFDDFHYAIDDYCASIQGEELGNRLVMKLLRMIEKDVGFSSFDTILLYSDHGFKRNSECAGGMSTLSRIGEDRSKVFLHIKKPGDDSIKTNDKLCGLMDIGPTLLNLCEIKVPYEVDGIDFFDKKEHDYIVINDHETFDVNFVQTIEIWGIRNKKGLAVVNRKMEWAADYDLSDDEKEDYIRILNEKGDFFKQNTLATKLMKYYIATTRPNKTFFDGSPRKKYLTPKAKRNKLIRKALRPVSPFLVKLGRILQESD